MIEQQLAAAVDHILRLLRERGPADPERLKPLVTERITAAVEEIFTAFRAARTGRDPQGAGVSPEPGPAAEWTGSSPETDTGHKGSIYNI